MMVKVGERRGYCKHKKNSTAQQTQTSLSHILSPYSVFWQVMGSVSLGDGTLTQSLNRAET
jgi:hypothetical protein